MNCTTVTRGVVVVAWDCHVLRATTPALMSVFVQLSRAPASSQDYGYGSSVSLGASAWFPSAPKHTASWRRHTNASNLPKLTTQQLPGQDLNPLLWLLVLIVLGREGVVQKNCIDLLQCHRQTLEQEWSFFFFARHTLLILWPRAEIKSKDDELNSY